MLRPLSLIAFTLLTPHVTGCAERWTLCQCILFDYAYEKRSKGDSGQETDSSSTCDCGANRKRVDEPPQPDP